MRPLKAQQDDRDAYDEDDFACESLEDFLAAAKTGLLPADTKIGVIYGEDRGSTEATIYAESFTDPKTGQPLPGRCDCEFGDNCNHPEPLVVPILDFTDLDLPTLLRGFLVANLPVALVPPESVTRPWPFSQEEEG